MPLTRASKRKASGDLCTSHQAEHKRRRRQDPSIAAITRRRNRRGVLKADHLKELEAATAKEDTTWTDNFDNVYNMSASRSSYQRSRNNTESGPSQSSRTSRSTLSSRARGVENSDVWETLKSAGVKELSESERPVNYSLLRDSLKAARASLSPPPMSPRAFQSFESDALAAHNETDVVVDVLPKVLGPNRYGGHASARNVPFTNLTLFTAGAPVPQPDLFDGLAPSDLHVQLRHELGNQISPAGGKAPDVVNFTLEAKGPQGQMRTAQRQVIHNLATGQRGIDALRSFKRNNEDDHIARSFGVTANNECLDVYATHSRAGPDPSTRTFHTSRIGHVQYVASPDEFRKAHRMMKNVRDMARAERLAAVERAMQALSSPRSEPETPSEYSTADEGSDGETDGCDGEEREEEDEDEDEEEEEEGHDTSEDEEE